ncbi:unnamed protein product [Umbelopsis vinacea]
MCEFNERVVADISEKGKGDPFVLEFAFSETAAFTNRHCAFPQNFELERDQFVKNKSNTEKTGRKGSEHVAAWVGFGDYEDILKTKILKLSLDRRNFLIDPPEDATYQFDLGVYGPVAAATLKEDPNLAKMRFELVPKVVKEPAFWHNYFYRVMLVKQSVFDGDNSNRDEIYEEKGNDEPKKDDVLFTFNDDDDDQDLDTTQVSTDSLANDEPTAVPASKDIASKPPTTKSQTDPGEMEDWEREMREAAGLF